MELEGRLEAGGRRTAADRLVKPKRGQAQTSGLLRHRRPMENVIRAVLFACAIISIFTTVSILFVLGNESLSFFSRWGFINTNQLLTAGVGLEDTVINVNGIGTPIKVDDVIELGEEMMRVIAISADRLQITVERGIERTVPESHPVGRAMFIGERPTLVEFLTGTSWQPMNADFGIWPLLMSTIITSIIAMAVAGPVGLGVAVYLSEYASPRLRAILKPLLEILAGIPTVVYGFFALTFMTPLLRAIFGSQVGVYNMASAGLVMGIMIIPTISSMSEDALSAVPRSLREGSYGMGATRLETVTRVLLPAALSGIMAAFILGISRAVGETMIVAIAAGAGPNFTLNPFQAAETMTGHIARISTGDLSFGSIDYNSVFAIGLTLFLLTLGLNLISNFVRRRFREVYQ